MNQEQIYQVAIEAVMECNQEKAEKALKEAEAMGIKPIDLLSNGFSEGMRELGDLFGRGEIFLPELMMATAVMKKASQELESKMDMSEQTKKGVMVIGTVAGDVHDIGKGIVCSLVKSNGIDVIDLGREVPALTFIEKAEEHKANFIGSSALLTTTMGVQQEIENILKKEGLREKYITLVGGAPVTKRWAEKIGANMYCEDASSTVQYIEGILK